MKFQPTFDNVIVRRSEVTKSVKGVILPESSVTRKNEGKIVAMGKDVCEDKSWCFDIGDTVLWSQYAGAQLVDPDDDQEYIILKDKDIIAVVKDTKVVQSRCC